LESLEKAVFPFASHCGLPYLQVAASPKGSSVFMIVCSCNVLSDDDVRSAVSASEDLPRNAKQIYGCLGCSAECGRCARTIKTIIDDALGACAKVCRPGCPHSQTEAEPSVHHHAEFLLAAS
jgi:bacterioferritin-associated ferredoxin